MTEQKKDPREINLLDDCARGATTETESGMYLSALADEPGEAEAAMVLNSLVDDPEDLNNEAAELIQGVEKFGDPKRKA